MQIRMAKLKSLTSVSKDGATGVSVAGGNVQLYHHFVKTVL